MKCRAGGTLLGTSDRLRRRLWLFWYAYVFLRYPLYSNMERHIGLQESTIRIHGVVEYTESNTRGDRTRKSSVEIKYVYTRSRSSIKEGVDKVINLTVGVHVITIIFIAIKIEDLRWEGTVVHIARMGDFFMSKSNVNSQFSQEAGRSHVLCIHVPHEVFHRHTVFAVITHQPRSINARGESQQLDQESEKGWDPGGISNGPTQRRRLTTHEGIESHPFRKDFDEIMNF